MRVKGSITVPANCKFAGGIVGWSQNSTIENCISSVKINSQIVGDGSHGGIVGCVEYPTTVIKDSAYSSPSEAETTAVPGDIARMFPD